MIEITEGVPNKLSGVSSLFVKFPFNQEIITTIKNADKYAYDSKKFIWELPITSLAYLLNNLTFIDDIKLTLIKEDKNKVHYYPKLEHKLPPFKHQLEAIEKGLNEDEWLLLDAPGAGKTNSIIYLAEELKEQKGLEHCLIICGINSLKSNWKKEIQKFSTQTCKVIGEKISKKGNITYASIKERAEELYNPNDAFFYILNIESLRNDDIIQALKTSKNKIDMIVVDEIHKCGKGSNQGDNLLKLKNYKYKIGLTGTLIVNSPLSAYLPLRFIGKEHATLTNFKSQYCQFGGFGGYQIVGYKNMDILKDVIDSCSLRRTMETIGKDIPPKNIIREVIEMNDSHRKFYEAIKDGVVEECDKIELKPNNVLALTTRLRQATSCPQILTTEKIESSKIQRALELIEEITSQGEKVVVMSSFKEPLNQLYEATKKEYNSLLATGDVSDAEFSKNIDLFQNNPKYKVFLTTLSKGGTGITLNAACYSIMLDLPWTYAMTEQAEDRIHRINNTKPAFIYRLICQGTVDEIVDRIVSTKRALSNYIVDDGVEKSDIAILRNYIQDL